MARDIFSDTTPLAPRDIFSGFFDDPTTWKVFASGQSEGSLHRDRGPDGKPALRMDYDFHGGGGFVVARKEIQFVLPDMFEFHFHMKGVGLRNNLEFKVIEPGNADVWRCYRENFELPEEWRHGRISERDLPFAWGPEGGGPPKVVGAIELVITAGPGGSGSVWFSDLWLEDQTFYLPKSAGATSWLPSHTPEAVFEIGSPSGWRAERGDTEPGWWVDFGRPIRFGGVIVHWPLPMPPRAFSVEISNDGETWTKIHQSTRAMGLHTHIPAPGAVAQHLRIHFANVKSAALRSLQLRPDSFSHSPNDFIHAVAVDFPHGWFPRYWYHEQSFWTPVGSPEGRRRALINEEGMVETDEGGFSLEPFLIVGEQRFVTWKDAEIQASMPDDGTPLPMVSWKARDVKLEIQPWVDCAGDSLVLRVTYRVENLSGSKIRLAVAIRPFQVNPPWQAFRNLGGISPIHDIAWSHGEMQVEGRRVIPHLPPDETGVASFEEDDVTSFLARGIMPPRDTLHDESGLASGVMAWKIAKDAEPFEVTVSVPFFGTPGELEADGFAKVVAAWHQILAPVEWRVPQSAAGAIQCFRTAAGHILINRDGPAIQPGPRRYTRSWVRDCVIMGAAMAKAGQPHVLKKFVKWYAKFQRDDGFVPCVVDRDGVDWLVEHDSHGQFIWGICEVFRGDHDKEFLARLWPHVKRAADVICTLRSESMPEDSTRELCTECYGLLPVSASHEGYLAHHVHSYWDDFWGIRGLEAAAELATAMGFPGDAARWHAEAADFLTDVIRSIRAVIHYKKIDYIPGSVEWADFDPTATANAIAQLDFAADLPAGPLQAMLDTYLEGFRAKHRGDVPWLNYTAYEIRIIGAFVRLGRREEALELLEFFLSDRRPRVWNQWPEITWRDPLSPGHLGDVPHTWIAAEYMLALASMVASEREATEALVLAAGLPWKWIAEEGGFAVHGLTIRFGRLDFQIRAMETHSIHVEIGEGISIAPGGITVAPPLPPGMAISSAIDQDGKPLEVIGGTSVAITVIPISVSIFLAARIG